jgi:hypothetical protein
MRRSIALLACFALTAACSAGSAGSKAPIVTPLGAAASRTAIAPDSVAFYAAVDSIPFQHSAIALVHLVPTDASLTDDELLRRYRPTIAGLGANGAAIRRRDGDRWIVALRVTAVPRTAADSIASISSGRVLADSSRSSAPAATGSSGGGTVRVRGYCRRDGVCVRPHTRSRPRRRP